MRNWWATGLFALLLWPGMQACHRAAYQYQPLPPAAATTHPETSPQLLFLSFRMTTNATGSHRIEPLLVKAVPGQANSLTDEAETGPSYLLIVQLDAQQKACGPVQRVAHPLVQHTEAPTDAGTGTMQHQLGLLTEAEFFVRVTRQPQARTVYLQEAGPAAPKPISATFPLPN